MEVRMATELGKCIRHMMRHPSEILLVSSYDRIARRPDIFELIQKQGLGRRIYDVSTGMNVDDIVKAGLHFLVEKQTKAKHKAQCNAIARLMADGVEHGSPDIAKHSKQASELKARMADDREAQVLSVISAMTLHGRGQRPSYADISDELDRQGIRTGQKRFMTPARLCQLRKRSPEKWDYAFDSYHRPRRRIRKLVNEALTEIQNQRKHRRRRIWLSNKTIVGALLHGITWSDLRSLVVGPKHLHDQILKQGGEDGCRGPPALIRHALKVAKNVMFSLTRMCRQPTVQRRH